MTDDQLRSLVRAAVARHLGHSGGAPTPHERPPSFAPAGTSAVTAVVAAPHASHAIYLALVNSGDACVIEPGVACNHCNYCRSHGH